MRSRPARQRHSDPEHQVQDQNRERGACEKSA